MPVSPVRLTERGSDALDSLRAVAAVLIVLHHVRIWIFASPDAVSSWTPAGRVFYRVTGLGQEYVLVFFVLSGFFIGRAVGRRMLVGQFVWRDYALDRCTRLYIVLIPALLFTAVVDRAGRAVAGAHSIYGTIAPYALQPLSVSGSHTTFSTLFGNIVFLQDLAVPTFGSDSPLWSLALEFWFYVAFPAALIFLFSAKTWPARLTSGGVTFVALVVLRANLILFVIWLVGAVIAFLPLSRVHVRVRAARVWAWSSVALLVLVLGAVVGHIGHRSGQLAVGIATAMVVAAVSHGYSNAGIESRPASGPLMSHLAKCSYTLYLFHAPVILFLSASAIRRTDQQWQPTTGHLLLAVGLTLAIVGAADAVSWATERRTAQLRSGLRAWLMVAGGSTV